MPAVTPPKIDRSLRLSDDMYYRQETKKSLIVLHHTVGGTAQSTIKYWDTDPRHIATAYVVSRGGTVFEVFDPKYWAWHLGVKDRDIEKRSIGIELASYGALTARKDKRGVMSLYAFDGKKRLGALSQIKNRYEHVPKGYRGYQWFARYSEKQVASTLKLVRYLCEKFSVPKKLPLEAATDAHDLSNWFAYKGIIHHAMVREDKSDLHLGFPFGRLGYVLDDPAWLS